MTAALLRAWTLVVCAAAMAGTLSAQQAPVVTALTAEWPEVVVVNGVEIVPVQKGVFMLAGAGAHVTAQVGAEGVTLVDSGAPGQGSAVLAAVRRLTRRPIRYLINTGSGTEHTGGNGDVVTASGGPAGPGGAGLRAVANENVGVMTIAHENAATRMSAGGAGIPVLAGAAIPVSTFFTARKDVYVNGEGIELLHQPSAHSDGDLVVYFRASDVVSAGEIYDSEGYPRIDLSRGGSVQGAIDALNALLDLTIPARNQMGGTRVIPARGRLANEADVVEYRDMVTIVRDRIQALVRTGATVQQVKAARPTLEYDGSYGRDAAWTGEMFIETIYRDLSGGK
ncbi:MAG: MBL fold metallo-hydrolase [Vicinamibacterales bacterium]